MILQVDESSNKNESEIMHRWRVSKDLIPKECFKTLEDGSIIATLPSPFRLVMRDKNDDYST